jgi:hypothetical protein
MGFPRKEKCFPEPAGQSRFEIGDLVLANPLKTRRLSKNSLEE